MILVDFSQVTYSTLMIQLGFDSSKISEVNEDMLRHMILNCLRSYNSKYKSEYGEMVIACDATSWRKDYFPYYKANRKKARDASEHDWDKLYEITNKIRDEFKEFMPYPVIHVDKAEADDVIATLIQRNPMGKILILSGDKDFKQLHDHIGVEQYDPTRKKWVELGSQSASDYLFEHILKGDSGDGVPNILSDDNCLVIGKRQSPLTQKRIDKLKNTEELKKARENSAFDRNYIRNLTLIDLQKTPDNIQESIYSMYIEQAKKDKSKLMNYFMEKKLKNLLENINEF